MTNVDEARRQISDAMLDGLKDRLPGLTRPQRLGHLRRALREAHQRCMTNRTPLEFGAAGKPLPAGPAETAFIDVSDVLFAELAAILGEPEGY